MKTTSSDQDQDQDQDQAPVAHWWVTLTHEDQGIIVPAFRGSNDVYEEDDGYMIIFWQCPGCGLNIAEDNTMVNASGLTPCDGCGTVVKISKVVRNERMNEKPQENQ